MLAAISYLFFLFWFWCARRLLNRIFHCISCLGVEAHRTFLSAFRVAPQFCDVKFKMNCWAAWHFCFVINCHTAELIEMKMKRLCHSHSIVSQAKMILIIPLCLWVYFLVFVCFQPEGSFQCPFPSSLSLGFLPSTAVIKEAVCLF